MSQMAPRDNSSPALLAGDAPGAALLARLSDYKLLVKPRITALVVITAAIGFAVAPGPATLGTASVWLGLAATMVGTALACMGASVFNQVWERDTDALMPRTADRPLPAGRVSVGESIALGIALSIAGVALLWLVANWLAAAIAAATIVSYAWVYTPAKRTTWLATMIGAVPGAAPPLIGAAAATGSLGVGAWLLFGILFLWQLPHFYAIAWLYRDDYAAAGLRMLPVVDPAGTRTFRQILISSAALLIVGLLPTVVGISGWWHFAAAALAGGVFLALGLRLKINPSAGRARALFLASLIYLPLVMTTMVVDMV
jgi:protoheme IX farnesyltransferase